MVSGLVTEWKFDSSFIGRALDTGQGLPCRLKVENENDRPRVINHMTKSQCNPGRDN